MRTAATERRRCCTRSLGVGSHSDHPPRLSETIVGWCRDDRMLPIADVHNDTAWRGLFAHDGWRVPLAHGHIAPSQSAEHAERLRASAESARTAAAALRQEREGLREVGEGARNAGEVG